MLLTMCHEHAQRELGAEAARSLVTLANALMARGTRLIAEV
jgi:hypothetical protein